MSFFCVLQENILQNEQHRKNIHQYADLFVSCLTCQQIQQCPGNNADGDTFGNAVCKRHCNDAEECRNCFRHIIEINLNHRTHHVEAYNDQRRSRRKGRDGQKER